MNVEEFELEELVKNIEDYLRKYLEYKVDESWKNDVSLKDFRTFIREVVKTGVVTFGRDDSFIVPVYKSFVIGLRIGRNG
jgi:phenolic acid decarboxylase